MFKNRCLSHVLADLLLKYKDSGSIKVVFQSVLLDFYNITFVLVSYWLKYDQRMVINLRMEILLRRATKCKKGEND